jgi:hypothetical protein
MNFEIYTPNRGPHLTEADRAIIAYQYIEEGRSLLEISGNSRRILGRHIPKSTAGDVVTSIKHKALIGTRTSRPVLNHHNLQPGRHIGAPKVLSEKQINDLIALTTKDKAHRLMAWSTVAKEAKLPGSRSTIERAMHRRGYGRYRI